MKQLLFVLYGITMISCRPESLIDISQYHELVNRAELLICEGNYAEATDVYSHSFQKIEKPFGKDVFNAALSSQLANQAMLRNQYLQLLINNSDDLQFVESQLVNRYISTDEWQSLIALQEIDYNAELREQCKLIHQRDQLFRPVYETYDDTINANRKLNLDQIFSLADSLEFPSHHTMGYTENLRGQKHHIVLYHTAQRRSYDKTVIDLEPTLRSAVQAGQLDPETAILYMNFQNDQEKGMFEVYAITQYKHPSFADDLNMALWLPNLTETQISQANEKRKEWYANSIDHIAIKSDFLSKSNLPFIFTSVRKSIINLSNDMDRETAQYQYDMMTSFMSKYEH